MRAILAGRRERFRELIERYQNRVFAILSRYERDRGRVEDIAQEVYVKAWRNLKKFDPKKAPFEHCSIYNEAAFKVQMVVRREKEKGDYGVVQGSSDVPS